MSFTVVDSVLELAIIGINILIAYFSRRNQTASRWLVISRLAVYVTRDVYADSKGKRWQELAYDAMRALVERSKMEPGIGTLKPDEIEKVKDIVRSEAMRLTTNGH